MMEVADGANEVPLPEEPMQPPTPVVVLNQQDTTVQMQILADKVDNIAAVLAKQCVADVITTFDGNPKMYREWIKSIEKYIGVHDLTIDSCSSLAFQASSGAVSSFLNRYISDHKTTNQQIRWADLKQELAKRFSDIGDVSLAMANLRSMKQKPNENVQVYCDRLLSLAELAYDAD